MKIILTKPVKKWLDKEKYVAEKDLIEAAIEAKILFEVEGKDHE